MKNKIVKITSGLMMLAVFMLTACGADEEQPNQSRVLWVSLNGSDDNPGTKELPLYSIGAALAQAKPGDVIELTAGTFRETVNFLTSGTPNQPITLRGALSESGERLTHIDPGVKLDPQKWEAAEGGGPGVFVYQGELPFKISQVISEKKKVASLYHRAGHNRDVDHVAPYSAWEILKWDRDHEITPVYVSQNAEFRTVSFWKTVGAVYYLADDPEASFGEKLYLRYEDGGNPSNREVNIYPDQPTILVKDVGHIRIQNLNIIASSEGVCVEGSQAVDNIIEKCSIDHGTTRVAFQNGANHGKVQGCEIRMGFGGWGQGAWGGKDAMDLLAKQFVYLYYKYWASRHTISNDRGIALHECSDIEVIDNLLDGGLVGISLIGAERIVIQGNTIQNHSSVGFAIRDRNSEVYIDSNELRNCNIQFRVHNLDVGWHRGIYLTRNVSILPNGVGSHVFCHVRGNMRGNMISADDTPQVIFLHNSFIGGYCGIRLPAARTVVGGLPKFVLVNNLFVVSGQPVFGQQKFKNGELTLGGFDYNLLIVPSEKKLERYPWFGSHNLVEENGIVNADHIPVSGIQRGKGIHLAKVAQLQEIREDGFDYVTDGYYQSETPDIGAVQLKPESN